MGRRTPNLFLIGAMKSGTTYLRKLLHAHPAIFMTDPDEPSYFVDPHQLKAIWPEMWERGLWRSEERYLALFDAAGDAAIRGEASTSYTKYPLVTGVADRIAAFNPDARFIYLLRDPVERALSHYWHMVRYHAETRPLAAAIRRDPQFIAFSNYAMQVKPFFERFGPGRVAIVTHESLVRDPAGVMREMYAWLGVGGEDIDFSDFARPEHVTPKVLSASRWGGVPRRLVRAPPFRGLMRHVPQPVQASLRHFTTRHIDRQAVDTAEAVAFLRPILRRHTDELRYMLGRDFPEWATLNGEALPRPPAATLRRLRVSPGGA